MESLRVAAIQAAPVPGDVAGNAALGAGLAGRAAGDGARVAVLPELFLPGYHPPTLAGNARTDVAADPDGGVADPRLDPLRDAARAHGTVLVVGAAVRHPDGRRTCSCLVVRPDGGIVAGYDKQHLCGPDEQALFTPGGYGAAIEVDGWHLGLGICYDGCFPEHGRAAAAAGAVGYLCPAGYVAGSEHRRDLYYRARALDNTMYVVLANLVGGAAPWRMNGGSAVYDPEGRTLGRAPDEGTATVIADLDPVDLARTRTEHPMLAERRSELGPRRTLLLT